MKSCAVLRRVGFGIMPIAIAAFAHANLILESVDSVTLDAKAKPLSVVVSQLGTLTGQTLEVAPALAADVFFVHVKDAPVSEVMERIARYSGGRWRTDPDGSKHLIDDPAAMNRVENELRAARAAYFTRVLKGLRESQEKEETQRMLKRAAAEAEQGNSAPDTNDAPEARQTVSRMFGGGDSPENTLLSKVALTLRPADLAMIEEGSRVVYSTSPTRMQRPMTIQSQLVATFLAEHNKLADAEGKAAKENPAERAEMMEQLGPWAEMMGMNRPRQGLATPPAKINLVVSNGGGGGMNWFMDGGGTMQLELVVFNTKGEIVASAEMPLQDYSESERVMEAVEDIAEDAGVPIPGKKPEERKPEPPKYPIKDGKIEQSEESKLVSSLNPMTMFTEGGSAKIDPKARAILSRPDMYDPLSFVHGDALATIAKLNDWQVIVNLPDGLDSGGVMSFARPETMAQNYYTALRENDAVVVDQSGNWLGARPASWIAARRDQVDRAGLTKLVAAATEKGVANIDDYATYAATSPSPTLSAVSGRYCMQFVPGAMGSMTGGLTNWDILRLYGSLSNAQRDQLKRGEGIPFNVLSQTQMATVRKLVFGAPPMIKVDDPGKETDQDDFMKMMVMWMPQKMTDYRNEPTEALPNGVPSNGTLKLNIEQDFSIVLADQDNPMSRMMGALGSSELAMMQVMSETKMFAQMAAFMPAMDKFKLGDRNIINIVLDLAPGIKVSERLVDDQHASSAKIVGLKDLTAEQQAKLEAKRAAFRKSPMMKFFDGSFDGGGTETTPP
ncbi:MAG: hypothetical protein JNM85_08625 [Chthonomonas sp.]|nr:hypothetical protein [Chthonomonas sp.]